MPDPVDLITLPENEQGVANTINTNFKSIEAFTAIMNSDPPKNSIKKTPDGKADMIPISFVEVKLDEVYLRQWGTRNVRTQQCGNEMLINLDLWVIDPQTGREITRAGFASVQIPVDAVPDRLKWRDGETEQDKKDRNAWALDLQNKKANGMALSYPKGKSLAIKNAAQTLGNIFGRNLNRKHEDSPGDFYGNLEADMATLTDAKKDIEGALELPAFEAIWALYPELHEVEEFRKHYTYYHLKLKRALNRAQNGK